MIKRIAKKCLYEEQIRQCFRAERVVRFLITFALTDAIPEEQRHQVVDSVSALTFGSKQDTRFFHQA